jgi:uncharacterized protein (TIGR03545 family)
MEGLNMRRKTIYLYLPLICLVGLLVYFFAGFALGWAVERSLEAVIGVKVELERVRLDLLKPAIQIGSIQITNPKNTWRNLIQAENIQCRLEMTPLYEGKIVIDEVTVDNLMVNTPRKTDGKIKRLILPGPFGKAQTKLYRDIATIPVLDPSSLSGQFSSEKILSGYKFEIDFSAETTNNKISAFHEKWQQDLQENQGLQADLAKLEKKIANFQSMKAENIVEIKQKLDLLRKVVKIAETTQQKYQSSKEQFQSDLTGLKMDYANLQTSADQDYRAILKQAKLPEFQSFNFVEALLGKDLLNESTYFLNLIDQMQSKIPVKLTNPPKEKHPRGGQDITFPGRETHPRFLIKHFRILEKETPDFKLDGFYARGSAAGITSEPPLCDSPMKAAFVAKAPGGTSLKINGQLDHRTPDFRDQFGLKIGGISLPNLQLPQNTYLPDRITSGNAEMTAQLQIKPGYFLMDLTLEARGLVCDYSQHPAAKDLMTGIVRDALSQVDQLRLDYRMEGVNEDLKTTISSNLNDLISAKLNAVAGEKLAKFSGEIRAAVDARQKEKQAELETKLKEYKAEISAKFTEVQARLDNAKQLLEARKKELETKLKQEKQKLLPSGLR